MTEIPASELRAGDIYRRVVVIDNTGNAYTGTLTDVNATDWHYGKRPEDTVKIRIAVKGAEGSELRLTDLPLDFRLQIDRDSDLTNPTDSE